MLRLYEESQDTIEPPTRYRYKTYYTMAAATKGLYSCIFANEKIKGLYAELLRGPNSVSQLTIGRESRDEGDGDGNILHSLMASLYTFMASLQMLEGPLGSNRELTEQMCAG